MYYQSSYLPVLLLFENYKIFIYFNIDVELLVFVKGMLEIMSNILE